MEMTNKQLEKAKKEILGDKRLHALYCYIAVLVKENKDSDFNIDIIIEFLEDFKRMRDFCK